MEEKFLESDGRAENSLRNYFFHLHHHHAPMNKNQQINFSIQFLILMLAGWAWWKRNVQLMAKQKIAFFFHCLLIPIPNLLHAAFGEYLMNGRWWIILSIGLEICAVDGRNSSALPFEASSKNSQQRAFPSDIDTSFSAPSLLSWHCQMGRSWRANEEDKNRSIN